MNLNEEMSKLSLSNRPTRIPVMSIENLDKTTNTSHVSNVTCDISTTAKKSSKMSRIPTRKSNVMNENVKFEIEDEKNESKNDIRKAMIAAQKKTATGDRKNEQESYSAALDNRMNDNATKKPVRRIRGDNRNVKTVKGVNATSENGEILNNKSTEDKPVIRLGSTSENSAVTNENFVKSSKKTNVTSINKISVENKNKNSKKLDVIGTSKTSKQTATRPVNKSSSSVKSNKIDLTEVNKMTDGSKLSEVISINSKEEIAAELGNAKPLVLSSSENMIPRSDLKDIDEVVNQQKYDKQTLSLVTSGLVTEPASNKSEKLSGGKIPMVSARKTETKMPLKTADKSTTSRQSKTKSSATKKSENLNISQGKLMTDFYPVRRSCRSTTTQIKKQERERLEELILSNHEADLTIVQFPEKGRGIVAGRAFARGEFMLEYSGELVDYSVAKQREAEYSQDQKLGCYMYYFCHKDKKYCVDATVESSRLGRLINHSRLKPNCATKVLEIGGVPRLYFVALTGIKAGEELLYDYGDRDPETLGTHPWLAY